ncbi:hypothetical protein [Aminobacter sp. HY435]|uniref:hypothetical protein n=1 Tax=Aminobacter sp. HY435 TaxID=2970917 RepID=UPI0022B982FF|nr:hypothetical protein [Aminobacter sp. HY435]
MSTTLKVDVYSRNHINAKRALEALRAAIDDLIDGWNDGKYRKLPMLSSDSSAEQPNYDHRHVEWTLNIDRPGGRSPAPQ